MDVGVLMFVTEHAVPVTDLARACEERGLESLWVPEHPVVPVEHATRYPLSAGKLPRPYSDGWMPIAAPPDAVANARREIDRLARERGRDPRRISISVMTGAMPGQETPALDMLPSREVLAAYAEAGADRVVASIPTLGAEDAYRHLDRIAAARA